ncbi:hypothetical protein KKG29_03595, partial [Patescibacteria group bacterium]|nr:hypothetical protein [Patescibacteria group bacterium]
MKFFEKSILIFFFFTALFLVLSSNAYARIDDCSTTTFSDGSPSETLIFPAGGGTNTDAKITLPKGATITSATVNLAPKDVIGTPYIWVPLTESNQLVQIKTSDGSFVSRFKRDGNTDDCTANCATNSPTWTPRSPASNCSANAFSNPSRITTIPGGDVWAADRVGSYVTRLGKVTGCAGDNCYECKGSYLVGSNPKGVTIDSEGNIWVGDNGDTYVWKFNPDGTYAWSGTHYVDIGYPTYGMMADSKGNIWISTGNSTGVVKINKDTCTQASCPKTVVSGGTFSLSGSSYGLGIDN